MKTYKLFGAALSLVTVCGLLWSASLAASAGDPFDYRYYDTETSAFVTETFESCNVVDATDTVWTDHEPYAAVGTLSIGGVSVNGDAVLLLTDGCRLTVNGGIHVSRGGSLTVYAQSDGTDTGILIADGSGMAAGIGSIGNGMNGGDVTIHGGVITANGGLDGGAGIGGGSDSAGGGITVYGGSVTATGGKNGAGIGGGYHANGSVFAIYGGSVTATGGENGAGIGGGYKGNGGSVSIYGGSVTANGRLYGAGIGGGFDGGGCAVTVTGGVISASGGENGGAGIGGGGCPEEYFGSGGSGGTLMIYEGRVSASGKNGRAVGSGSDGLTDTVITVVRRTVLNDDASHTPITVSGDETWMDVLGGRDAFSFTAVPAARITYLSYDPTDGEYTEKTLLGWEYLDLDGHTTAWKDDFYAASGVLTIDEPVTVKGNVSLILSDGCTLTVTKGIRVDKNDSLTIYTRSADNGGTLTVTGVGSGAGIGGGDNADGGRVTIHGGNIRATGGGYGAGIGGGDDGAGAILTVYGGNVEAYGGDSAAGIGGGYDAGGGQTTVYGGVVTAKGGSGGAGIGSGDLVYTAGGGSLTVYGGSVTATGVGGGAGIGGGSAGSGGSVTICGGVITAIGGEDGAGIGGGRGSDHDSGGNGGSVTVKGGRIRATGGSRAAAIGHGGGQGGGNGSFSVADGIWLKDDVTGIFLERFDGMSWFDVLTGQSVSFTAEQVQIVTYLAYDTAKDAFVSRTRGECYNTVNENITAWENSRWYVADGVTNIGRVTVSGNVHLILKDDCELTVDGGISVANGGTLTVYAETDGESTGSLTVVGEDGAAGIGGGTVVIHGGNISAVGGNNGAGIGGGEGENGHTLIVYGGSVSATAGEGAARGIGAGVGGIDHGTLSCGTGVLFDKTTGDPIERGFDEDWIDALDGKTVFFTVGTPIPVSYRKYGAAEPLVCGKYTVIHKKTASWTNGWYVTEKSGTIDGAVSVSGNVSLILADGCTLTVNGGIVIPNGSSLTVYAMSDGENAGALTVNGADGKAGIDGSVTIHGGNVTARGGNNGAGIGGGNGCNGGNVTVYGGHVSAFGGANAAGIGGGSRGNGGTFAYYGGTVTVGQNSTERGIGAGVGGADNGNILIPGDIMLIDLASGSPIRRDFNHNWAHGGLTFTGAPLEPYVDTVPYITYNTMYGRFVSENCGQYMLINKNTTEWNDTLTGWYVMEGSGTINGLVTVSGDVCLLLKDGCSLTVTGGISVAPGNSFTVYAQSNGSGMGSLTVRTDRVWTAGIGGAGDNPNCGVITFECGDIHVMGSAGAASIGVGSYGRGGDITIYGGVVDTSVNHGNGSGGILADTVTIYGGNVTAAPDMNSSATGLGGNVTVHGGTVNVKGGYNSTSGTALGGNLTVRNGIVNIISEGNAAIGDVTIYRGNVTVEGARGSGIEGNVTVYDGILSSKGGRDDPGIGGNGKKVNIYGGNVTAYGSFWTFDGRYSHAAIEGIIDITGGKVFAYGHGDCAAIIGTLSVSGGDVTAVGGNEKLIDDRGQQWKVLYSAGINADITISGGKVTSIGFGGHAAIEGSITVADGILLRDAATKAPYRKRANETWNDVLSAAAISFNASPAEKIPYVVYSAEEDGYVTRELNAWECVPFEAGTTAWTEDYLYVADKDVTVGAVTVSGNVRLILADGVCLTVNGGMTVGSGGSLTVYGQSHGDYDDTGVLKIVGTDGSRPAADGGTITLCSGIVRVTGSGDIGIGSALTLCGGQIGASGRRRGFGGNVTVADGLTPVDNATGLTREQYPGILDGENVSVRLLPSSDFSSVDYRVYHADTASFSTETCTDCKLIGTGTTVLESGYYTTAGDMTVPDTVTVRGDVYLILKNDRTLTVGGITVADGGHLTVFAQTEGGHMGRLTAAGIVGDMTVHGGHVTADGSGIRGNITLCGGRLYASGVVGIDGDVVIADGMTPVDNRTGLTLEGCPEMFAGTTVDVTVVPSILCEAMPYLAYDAEKQALVPETRGGLGFITDGGDDVWESGWYAVYGGVRFEDTVTVRGDVRLILADGCELAADGGIHVPENGSLTIYAQSEGEGAGRLIACGDSGNAGIGGGADETAGTVAIHGGNITAYGGYWGAGIGSGDGGFGGNVTIYGGDVTSEGVGGGAGIGSGMYSYAEYDDDYGSFSDCGSAGTIEIYGGTVRAKGDGYGAGIGGGEGSDGGSVTIYGGKVTAEGGDWGGCGIGCGLFEDVEYGNVYTVYGGDVRLFGGDTTAVGGEGGTAFNDYAEILPNLAVTVNDDTVIDDPSQYGYVGYSNHKIRVTETENRLSVTFDGNAFIVTTSGRDAHKGVVAVVLYESTDKDRIRSVRLFDLTKETPAGVFAEDGGYVKAYWWTDMSSLRPVCKPAGMRR